MPTIWHRPKFQTAILLYNTVALPAKVRAPIQVSDARRCWLSPGAPPAQDAIVIGLSRMNRILNVDFENRTISVETGITNLAITEAVSAEGFFYAPDPSSQLACTLGGNLAMNSGGAHCLKY